MDAQKTKAKPNKSDTLLFVRLLITVALATAAAFVFRRSSGLLAMLPVCTLICLAAAFVNIGGFVRCAVFGIIVFAFNTVEQGDFKVTLTFTLLCVFAVAVFGYGAALLRGKKRRWGLIFALEAAAVLGLAFAFCILFNNVLRIGERNAITLTLLFIAVLTLALTVLTRKKKTPRGSASNISA